MIKTLEKSPKINRIFFIIIILLSLYFLTSPVYSQTSSKKLYIRTNKSYVQPGSSYTLWVFENLTPLKGYTGFLDVYVISCTATNVCTTKIVPWGDYYVQNGSITINIPSNFPPSYFRARFKPRNSNWDWSNEIQINVGTTQGLENTQDYWFPLYPTNRLRFLGYNFVDKKFFKTEMIIGNSQNLCGENVIPIYFMKDNQYGYWDPHFPWFDEFRGSGYDKQNLLWFVVPWQKRDDWKAIGFDDEYLTSIGFRSFSYNPSDPFNLNANFAPSRMVVQKRIEFPNYVLSAKWVGQGWAFSLPSRFGPRISAPEDPTKDFCTLPVNTNPPAGTWAVHVNLVNLNLPNYKGPALQYKFYEGGPNAVNDGSQWLLREDWYFIKNKGLAKIEVKNFKDSPEFKYLGLKSCLEDSDCVINEAMVNPHLRLVREDLVVPFYLRFLASFIGEYFVEILYKMYLTGF